VDSHLDVPIVEASLKDLAAIDFAPFKALNDMPWAMTAHVIYTALDRNQPATISPQVIAEAVRGIIGFRGILLSDDIGMSALKGSFAERAAATIKAGCDVALHCSGEPAEMAEVVEGAGSLSAAAERRFARAEAMRRRPDSFDRQAAAARVESLLAG
jgi:beta-N-acetylhexosaminidase